MTCQNCGSRCTGKLCAGCEQIQINEKLHGSEVQTESTGDGGESDD